jgi:hypothetical protein
MSDSHSHSQGAHKALINKNEPFFFVGLAQPQVNTTLRPSCPAGSPLAQSSPSMDALLIGNGIVNPRYGPLIRSFAS